MARSGTAHQDDTRLVTEFEASGLRRYEVARYY